MTYPSTKFSKKLAQCFLNNPADKQADKMTSEDITSLVVVIKSKIPQSICKAQLVNALIGDLQIVGLNM